MNKSRANGPKVHHLDVDMEKKSSGENGLFRWLIEVEEKGCLERFIWNSEEALRVIPKPVAVEVGEVQGMGEEVVSEPRCGKMKKSG